MNLNLQEPDLGGSGYICTEGVYLYVAQCCTMMCDAVGERTWGTWGAGHVNELAMSLLGCKSKPVLVTDVSLNDLNLLQIVF